MTPRRGERNRHAPRAPSRNTNIHVTTTASSSACRIDHNSFTNSGLNIFIQVDGQGPCLIDHDTFTGGPASEMIHTTGANAGSNAAWGTLDWPAIGPDLETKNGQIPALIRYNAHSL